MINLVLIKMVDTQTTLPSLHQLLVGETFPSSSLSCGFTVNYSLVNIFCKQVYVHSTPWLSRQRLLGFAGKVNASRRYTAGIKIISVQGQLEPWAKLRFAYSS